MSTPAERQRCLAICEAIVRRSLNGSEFPERPEYYWYYARDFVVLCHAYGRDDLLQDADAKDLHKRIRCHIEPTRPARHDVTAGSSFCSSRAAPRRDASPPPSANMFPAGAVSDSSFEAPHQLRNLSMLTCNLNLLLSYQLQQRNLAFHARLMELALQAGIAAVIA